MIGAEDDDDVRLRLLDQIDVLVDRVRRAPVPGLAGGAHLRRHRDDELRAEDVGELPAVLQVQQQRLALELHQHVDREDAAVDEIAEHEVDDPVLAGERHRRLRALIGQRRQPRSLAAGKHERQRAQIHAASPILKFIASTQAWKGICRRPRNSAIARPVEQRPAPPAGACDAGSPCGLGTSPARADPLP